MKLFCLLFLKIAHCQQYITLGGLFEPDDDIRRATLRYAVERQNLVHTDGPRFLAHSEYAMNSNPFQVVAKVCDLIEMQSIVIFGPTNEPAISQVRSICDTKEVPQVLMRMGGEDADSFAIDLYPSPSAIGKALADIVHYYGWTSIVILYQEDKGLSTLQKLLEIASMSKGPQIILRKLSSRRKDFKPLLKEIKGRLEKRYVLVDSDLETVEVFMNQAAILDMVGDYYHYIFTHLDVYTLDLDRFKEQGCNISGLRLVDAQSQRAQLVRSELEIYVQQSQDFSLPPRGIPTDVALIYDAVGLITDIIRKMGHYLPSTGVSCDNDQTWRNGSTFKNELRVIDKFEGLTGLFRLNPHGRRERYTMEVVELSKGGFDQLGVWNEDWKPRLNITRSYAKSLEAAVEALENKTLRVTVYLEEPFVMLKQTDEVLTGNDRYEGYCIDLLNEIAKIRRFKYILSVVKDNAYGSELPDGSWNGMVGELVRGEADLAAASLTISYSRSEVVDFTVPFMHLGISILFKKPVKTPPALFTFLSPLSLDVWIYMLVAYVGISLILWILARFSPYEWYSNHPCSPNRDVVDNNFNLLNAAWFTVGSLMQQGSDLAPKAPSTRLVAGIWWLFCLILISSYTANLAAFLTVERMSTPIENADDLAKQVKIKYGTLNSGSSKSFFRESKIQTYERMWAFMESAQPSVFVNSSREGILRVKGGDYAYLMESSMLEYYIERDCSLVQIGGLIDSKGYGIGLAKNSPWREPISSAILMLQENTLLTSLKAKWWKQKRGGGKCDKDSVEKTSANALGLENVGGVFVLLLFGTVCSIILGLFEFVYKAKKIARQDKKKFCSVLWKEFQFAMKCHGSTRPARKRREVPEVNQGEKLKSYNAVPRNNDSLLYNS